MMEQKTTNWLKHVEYGALGFIGSAFLINGLSYFKPQAEYYVPRILMPLFEFFGNVGLAVGLLLLGAGMIVYGFICWRKYGGRVWMYAMVVTLAAVLFALLGLSSGKAEEPCGEERREEQVDQIRNSERPELAGAEANAFFDDFEALLSQYREHTAAGDTQGAEQDAAAYYELMQKMPAVVEPLSADDKYSFSVYSAKLQIEWSEVAQ